MPAAAGPLMLSQSLEAALETSTDRDYFYFYVTAPGAVQVELAVRNLGGGGKASDIDATILDSAATPLAGQAFIEDGETRLMTATLEAQKYFIEVSPSSGFGDSYSLTAAGGSGAFGSYARIAGRCASADSALREGQRALSRAATKLQRATARLRRSRYASLAERRLARAERREAIERVRLVRRGLRQDRRSRRPWCFIAE